jgi:hypothetical protein
MLQTIHIGEQICGNKFLSQKLFHMRFIYQMQPQNFTQSSNL